MSQAGLCIKWMNREIRKYIKRKKSECIKWRNSEIRKAMKKILDKDYKRNRTVKSHIVILVTTADKN